LEVHEAKGTARLLHRCLPASRIVVGEQFDAAALHSLLYAPWTQGEIQNGIPLQPVLLYPQASEATDASPRPAAGRYRLVVLDGTWRKSRKMLHLNPLLAALPRFGLVNPAPSLYQIRKAHHPQQLSTLEAVHHALVHLEGNPGRFEPLMQAFSEFVARQLRYAQTGRRMNDAP
ncbi:MAG: tRNA-uridine aminocarboxypropyltransferase, partial [Burkholderiaceae bacterium]